MESDDWDRVQSSHEPVDSRGRGGPGLFVHTYESLNSDGRLPDPLTLSCLLRKRPVGVPVICSEVPLVPVDIQHVPADSQTP